MMTRRDAVMVGTGLVLAPAGQAAALPGRLKQSVARWCYERMSLDDLCRQAAELGIAGIDLVDSPDWPTLRKYNLTPSVVTGAGTIPSGWNRPENHDRLARQMQDNILLAAAAKVPNVITFSGNRDGMADQEGKQHCIAGLRRVSKFAEDHGVTICMELLNSKIDHKDHQCDHTPWAVDVVKAVDSPRVKLLYDIYHMQIMEGDIIRTIQQNIQYIAHFHTGGVPGRHELDDTQELQWRTIFKAIADLNFPGFIGHEFVPTKAPMAALKQAVELCTV